MCKKIVDFYIVTRGMVFSPFWDEKAIEISFFKNVFIELIRLILFWVVSFKFTASELTGYLCKYLYFRYL